MTEAEEEEVNESAAEPARRRRRTKLVASGEGVSGMRWR